MRCRKDEEKMRNMARGKKTTRRRIQELQREKSPVIQKRVERRPYGVESEDHSGNGLSNAACHPPASTAQLPMYLDGQTYQSLILLVISSRAPHSTGFERKLKPTIPSAMTLSLPSDGPVNRETRRPMMPSLPTSSDNGSSSDSSTKRP
jgi:hypothetical protein